jgi:hypothetical protein
MAPVELADDNAVRAVAQTPDTAVQKGWAMAPTELADDNTVRAVEQKQDVIVAGYAWNWSVPSYKGDKE